ncbi:MAG: tetratricopeptide repeat protein [Rikenella sp.]|nr:tetratricopeptide repeat protein [Rikenella sp.]
MQTIKRDHRPRGGAFLRRSAFRIAVWCCGLAVFSPLSAVAAVAAVAVEADSTAAVAEGMAGGVESVDSLWSRANAAYNRGEFRQAAAGYEAVLARGAHSAKLYYNLGNSWFKQGRMGRAILNYNRALLLDPTDEDTQYNLAMANVRIVDRIDTVPEFFLKTWLRELGLQLGTNTWAVLGLVFLGLTFGSVLLWLLGRRLGLRKAGFYGGICAAVLCFVSTFYAGFQRRRLLYGREAVVMNLMAPVKSAPGAGSKDIFVLHEGTKVRMVDELEGWTEIVLSDGNKGWIASIAVEAIVPSAPAEADPEVDRSAEGGVR